MANARINLKTIDYYRFRKLVVDGNRDDYSVCSKEVRQLCDHVQTFNCRDDVFDEEADRERFDEICCYYRQILNGKRINPIDMRIKSGWWGDQKGSAYAVGKIKPAVPRALLLAKASEWARRKEMSEKETSALLRQIDGPGINVLRELLLAKTSEWARRKEMSEKETSALLRQIDGPGIYVFKHRERQCFQYVGRSTKIFTSCAEKLKLAYEGKSIEPLAALFLITLASDWEFYFQPVLMDDEEKLLRILENDIILRHDCIWPHGLNFQLQINSLLEVSEFRKSCLRYSWPPPCGDNTETHIDLNGLREQLKLIKQREKHELEVAATSLSTAPSSTSSSRRSSVTELQEDAVFQELPPSPTQPFPEPTVTSTTGAGERPTSPLSVISTATYTVDSLEGKCDATRLIKATQQRSTPPTKPLAKKTMGKENVRKKELISASNQVVATKSSRSPKPPRKPGLLDYPIDESVCLGKKDEANDDYDEGEDDTDGSPNESIKAAERPTALPIRSPRQPGASPSPARIKKVAAKRA